MIILITGGVRSGKTQYAEKVAIESCKTTPVYVATARFYDGDFNKRILEHKISRKGNWTLIEESLCLAGLDLSKKTVVIDCVSMWANNVFQDKRFNFDDTLNFLLGELDLIFKKDTDLIFVSNEVGLGIHPDTDSGRKFVDILGVVNKCIANRADKLILMVSGIPLCVKG